LVNQLINHIGFLLFVNPEIVANANIPKRAPISNMFFPSLIPAPKATRIESLIKRLIINAGVKVLQRVPPKPIEYLENRKVLS
jgi:hypothetical protein